MEQNESNKSTARDRLLARANKAEKFAARRGQGGTHARVVLATNAKKRKAPPQIFNQAIQYDFLQYSRIVYRWAVANHGLKRAQIDLLLYLNPIGIFGKADFDFFYKTIGIYQGLGMQKLMDAGWIIKWRESRHGQRALYTLSDKGKLLCNRMHRMFLGEETIPETSRYNAMVADKSVVINKYYMDVVKSLNKKIKAKTPSSV